MKTLTGPFIRADLFLRFPKAIFFLIFILQSTQNTAQSVFTYSGGAHSAGIARAGVNLLGIEGAYCNQAGLTEIRKSAFDISVEKRFNINELTCYAAASAFNFRGNTIGLMMSGLGLTDYNEQKFGLFYARKLHPAFRVGGQLSILRFNIQGFESRTTPSIELGMIVKLSDELSWAAHIFAPGDAETNGEFLKGTRMRMGINYKPSEKLMLMAEIEKRVERFPTYMVCMLYQFNKSFGIRLGVNPRLRLFGFGFAVSFKDTYKMVAAACANDVIGNTPAVSFQYTQ
jgi:hypothetical protein